jgi:hypothetical protein
MGRMKVRILLEKAETHGGIHFRNEKIRLGPKDSPLREGI